MATTKMQKHKVQQGYNRFNQGIGTVVSASLHGYEFTLFNVIVNMHVGHLLTGMGSAEILDQSNHRQSGKLCHLIR